VERDDLAPLAGVFSDSATLMPGAVVSLDEDTAHHLRVRRLAVGDRVHVADGAGTRAVGTIARLAKKDVEVSIDDVTRVPRPPEIHVAVPVADRDRMLWCAEKCAELGATSWRPVVWNRSRSVSPRGEGEAFAAKVRARMISALVQSHAPWLPDVHREGPLADVVAGLPARGTRFLLDASGSPIGAVAPSVPVTPVTLAVGPEGGFEPTELEILHASGFRAVSLGANVLRFETATVAALAIVRSTLSVSSEKRNG